MSEYPERQCDKCKHYKWCMKSKSVWTAELCRGYELKQEKGDE